MRERRLSAMSERGDLHNREEPATKSDEIDVVGILALFWSRRFLLIGLVVAGLAVGAIILHMAVPTYTAQLQVTAMANKQGGVSSSGGGLGGLGSMFGISIDGGDGATPFQLYKEALRSREVARILTGDEHIMHTVFVGYWNEKQHRWQEPSSITGSIKSFVRSLFGFFQREWSEPDAADLQGYLGFWVRTEQELNDPVLKIKFDHSDPQFAVYLLSKLNDAADNIVRQKMLRQATEYAAYLTSKLQTATVAEYRTSLAEALSEQERSIMMASSDVPYAAMAIEAPTATKNPTKPRATMVLVVSVILAAIVGVMLVLLIETDLITSIRHRSRR